MENNLNLPPFYVGQKVVALDDGIYTIKGKEYVVLALNKCCKWLIDVGHSPVIKPYHVCSECRKYFKDGILWATASRFAPIQENFQSISLSKICEEETKLVSVN